MSNALADLIQDRLSVREAVRVTKKPQKDIELLRSITKKSRIVIYIPVMNAYGERVNRFYLNATIYKIERESYPTTGTMVWFKIDEGQEKKLALLEPWLKIAEENLKAYKACRSYPASYLVTNFVGLILRERKHVYFASEARDYNAEKQTWFFRYELVVYNDEELQTWVAYHGMSPDSTES